MIRRMVLSAALTAVAAEDSSPWSVRFEAGQGTTVDRVELEGVTAAGTAGAFHQDIDGTGAFSPHLALGLSWQHLSAAGSDRVNADLLRPGDAWSAGAGPLGIAAAGWRIDLALAWDRHRGTVSNISSGGSNRQESGGVLAIDALTGQGAVLYRLDLDSDVLLDLPGRIELAIGPIGAVGYGRTRIGSGTGRWAPINRYGLRTEIAIPLAERWHLGLCGGYEWMRAEVDLGGATGHASGRGVNLAIVLRRDAGHR